MGHPMLYIMTLFGCALTLCMHVQGSLLQAITTNRIHPVMLKPGQTGLTTETLSLQSLPLLANLGPKSSFRYLNGNFHKSAKGVKRVRLIQTYGGYDVFGSSVGAEMDAEGKFTGQMHGQVIKNLHKYIRDPEVCRRNVKHLQMKAIKLERISVFDPNVVKRESQRIIFPTPELDKVRMVYKVAFFYNSKKRVTYPVYFFDACTGAVLKSFDKLQTLVATTGSLQKYQRYQGHVNVSTAVHDQAECPVSAEGEGGNEKMGKIIYNNYPHCLNVQKTDDTCKMAGTYVDTIDNEKSTSYIKTKQVEFTCAVGYKDPINGAYGVANDAFAYGENFGELFRTKYQMEVLDYRPRVVVHYSDTYENAFCDGTDTFYGDGDIRFFPLVSVDVVAHELGHAVTDKNSGLIYDGQSGGMNEAFSDILGATATGFARGPENLDWTVGGDIDKQQDALRYMFDPPLDGRSIKNVDQYFHGINVHYSSGIYNFAFYTMVHVKGMDLYEAFRCFLDANLNLWKPNSDFYTGACDVLKATYDNGYDVVIVKESFEGVGINLDDCEYSALSTTMFAGETRDNILVSSTRSPVLKIELDQRARFTQVEVVADDKSTDVHVVVGKDDMATDVITKGNNSVIFYNTRRHVYVQLRSDAKVDIPVQINVSS